MLLLSACSGRSNTSSTSAQGDTITLRYSENLSIVDYEDYTLAQLRNPWDTTKILHTYILVDKEQKLPEELPAGTIVRTPLSKAVIYSSVHCSLLKKLGALEEMKYHIHKVQCVFQNAGDEEEILAKLEVLQHEKRGSVMSIVARGTKQEILMTIQEKNPLLAEILPLTLEEIFISETEVAGYDIKNFIS